MTMINTVRLPPPPPLPYFLDNDYSRYDSDSQDDDFSRQSEEEVLSYFDHHFFRRHGRDFCMKEGDAYVLDPHVKNENSNVDIYNNRNASRNLFARDIRTFKNGSSVSKHCEPWGECAVLNNENFIIKQKFFSASGLYNRVLIKSEVEPFREYLLEPPFFSGWADMDAIQSYYDLALQK